MRVKQKNLMTTVVTVLLPLGEVWIIFTSTLNTVIVFFWMSANSSKIPHILFVYIYWTLIETNGIYIAHVQEDDNEHMQLNAHTHTHADRERTENMNFIEAVYT